MYRNSGPRTHTFDESRGRTRHYASTSLPTFTIACYCAQRSLRRRSALNGNGSNAYGF
ncbi:hypothetical protein GA0061093_12639 [Rhodococcus qingshengii]|nr:hypothetical protein GA0061093_12639 [Rhodococcus qingshengii]